VLQAVAAEPAMAGVVVVTPQAPIQGALPNGLHYLIIPHTAPRGGISLRLIVEAGSLDEHDDERGFAHFVLWGASARAQCRANAR
jgi:zinc protease